MSELVVGSLKGLSANNFEIEVASGSKIVQPGAILQVVSTTKTDAFSTTSNTFTPVTGLSATITPRSANSRIVILASVIVGASGSSDGAPTWRISGGNASSYVGNADGSRTRGLTTHRLIGAGDVEMQDAMFGHSGVYYDAPNTTSAVTYQVELMNAGGNSRAAYVNRIHNDANSSLTVRGASSILLMEVAG
jgi:hypothetical protein